MHPRPVVSIKIVVMATTPAFREPTSTEKFFNRGMAFLVSIGFAPSYMQLLEVRGRKSGKLYTTPVDLLELQGKRYLVAPRGRTQWVRNAEVSGEITLKRGSKRQSFVLRALSDVEKLPILKAYLDNFKTAVQRYFPVPAGSPPQAFAEVAATYPAFELLEK